MSLKCDYCRSNLGLGVHRYWQMRFCSTVCVESYQRRLDEDTRVKIQHLDFAAPENSRQIDYLWLGRFIGRLPE
jgi:hypothetical protein